MTAFVYYAIQDFLMIRNFLQANWLWFFLAFVVYAAFNWNELFGKDERDENTSKRANVRQDSKHGTDRAA